MKIFIITLISFVFLIKLASADDSGMTDNYPMYQDGELIIPRVDTVEQAGNFQDAKFMFNEQTGTWKLEEFKTKTTNDTLINGVELILTNTMPIQAFLKVNGALTFACSELGQVSQRVKDNRFEILIHDGPSTIPPGTGCNAGTKPFETIVPLSVYSLSAGTYEYSVNGGDIGTFALIEDNVLVQ